MPVSGSVMTSYGGKIECFPFIVCFSKSQDMKFVAKLCVLITGIYLYISVYICISTLFADQAIRTYESMHQKNVIIIYANLLKICYHQGG